HAFY
ncbi:hypothetical protein D039_2881B, partial [Vibrio parahaemolyticus EKP-028]